MTSTSVTNSAEAEETSWLSADCPSAAPEQEYKKTESPTVRITQRAKGNEKNLNINGSIGSYVIECKIRKNIMMKYYLKHIFKFY